MLAPDFYHFLKNPDLFSRQEQKQILAHMAFGFYLRKGFVPKEIGVLQKAVEEAAEDFKFNPYHDPTNGRFTSGPGGTEDKPDEEGSGGSSNSTGNSGNDENPSSSEGSSSGGSESENHLTPMDYHPGHLNVDGAVNYLNQAVDKLKTEQTANGQPNLFGEGRCAAYVRKALNAGGGLDVGTPADDSIDAEDYGPPLEKAGFQAIASSNSPATYPPEDYVPQAGDVAVIQSTSQSEEGHMAMYNGQQWVSDFRQQGFWPGASYRSERPSFVIYRYPGTSRSQNI